MQAIEYTPEGFRIVRHDGDEIVWSLSDLPASVDVSSAAEVEDWMNANLSSVVGMFVAVRVDSLDPFSFRMAVSVNPIDRTALDPQGLIGDGGGGG